MPKKPKKQVPYDEISGTIESILESEFWLPSIETETIYDRLHDDHDERTMTGVMKIMFAKDGDAGIWITGEPEKSSPTLRFRTHTGGGQSPRTRVALLILARAIQLDNEKD